METVHPSGFFLEAGTWALAPISSEHDTCLWSSIFIAGVSLNKKLMSGAIKNPDTAKINKNPVLLRVFYS